MAAKKSEVMQVRVDPEIKALIKELARKDQRSVSVYLERIVLAAVQASATQA